MASHKTVYLLQIAGPRRHYVRTWHALGWSYDTTADPGEAHQFPTMTAATLVAFCLVIDAEAVPADQMELPLA